MPALSFKKQFAKPILTGRKKQTIRRFRKYPIMLGQTLYLYTGLRTKYVNKLKEVRCTGTYKIKITGKSITIYDFNLCSRKPVVLKGEHALNAFAKRDGFKNFSDMKAFWIAEHGKEGSPFPFYGTLITW